MMSYEYKKSIKRDLEILNQLREVTDWRVGKEIGEKQMELDYIYAQASKADEYEAKAKAFDEVMDLYVNGSNKYLQTKRHTLDVFIEDVAEILKPFTDKYESGEAE